MPRLTSDELRPKLIEHGVKGLRGLGLNSANRYNVTTDQKLKAAFAQLLTRLCEDDEASPEAVEAAKGLLREIGPVADEF
jgi:hypothetical protein